MCFPENGFVPPIWVIPISPVFVSSYPVWFSGIGRWPDHIQHTFLAREGQLVAFLSPKGRFGARPLREFKMTDLITVYLKGIRNSNANPETSSETEPFNNRWNQHQSSKALAIKEKEPHQPHRSIMDEYDDQYQQDEGGEAEAAPAQPDGAFARVNGGMLQSGKFSNQIVSLVGNITAHDTIRTADGSEVRIASEHLTESESGALIVDPNNTIEIMGQASGPTDLTVRRLLWVVL
jgi:hypothetical protein